MTFKSGCLLCGEELIYFDSIRPLNCAICGKTFEADASCVSGHYVCDACHSSSTNEWIEGYCLHSTQTNPVAMAIMLMKNDKVKMHGPEHHFLVPAVLLTAYYNLLGLPDEKKRKLREAHRRIENLPGDSCGFFGVCGAGIGTGVFVSLIMDATPLSPEGWRLSNLATAQSLEQIACPGGPRCCKRDTFLALQMARAFLVQHFEIDLPISEPVMCSFSSLNKDCLKEACLYYSGL